MSPCPASWNASRHGCIRITTVELLHHECVDYCGMQNASLYCVRSAEQHALVSDLLDDFARTEEVARVGVNNVWLGNHRGSESGWSSNLGYYAEHRSADFHMYHMNSWFPGIFSWFAVWSSFRRIC